MLSNFNDRAFPITDGAKLVYPITVFVPFSENVAVINGVVLNTVPLPATKLNVTLLVVELVVENEAQTDKPLSFRNSTVLLVHVAVELVPTVAATPEKELVR